MAWYNEVDKAITVISAAIGGSILTVAAGIIALRNKWSGSNTQVVEDKVQAQLMLDLQNDRKVAYAERDAALMQAQELMKQRIIDAGTIAAQSMTIESLKERAKDCEAATLRAERWAVEAEQQRREVSEQLLYSHMRTRKMFSVITRLDPVAAAEVTKESLDDSIKVAVEAVKLENTSHDPTS